MDSISKKITSRPGFSKAILVIREKIVCFKEGKKLLSDDGLHSFPHWNRLPSFKDSLYQFLFCLRIHL